MALFDFMKKKKEEEPGPMLGPPPGPPAGAVPPTDRVIQMQQQGASNEQIIAALQRQGYNQAQIYDALNQAAAKRSVEAAQPRPAMKEETEEEKTEKFEEIAEAIIEEKWQAATKRFGKLKEWQEETNERIIKLEQGIMDLHSDLDNLHKALVGKISEYDKNLLDVGTEIKAMERVFQKILPEMTKNVRELSEAARTFKEKKSQ